MEKTIKVIECDVCGEEFINDSENVCTFYVTVGTYDNPAGVPGDMTKKERIDICRTIPCLHQALLSAIVQFTPEQGEDFINTLGEK